MTTPNAALADADLLYLVRLADWAAGQGFCQIDGIEDPEEWCFRKWSELGPPNGDGYSAEALATALRQPSSVVVERVARAMFPSAWQRKDNGGTGYLIESEIEHSLALAKRACLAALPLDEIKESRPLNQEEKRTD
jgi:hypothetical protein